MKNRILLCLLLLLAACSNSSDSTDPGSGSSDISLNRQQFTVSADSSGIANFSFTLPAGTNAFQISASSGSLRALRSASTDFFDRTDLLSTAQQGSVSNTAYYAGGVPVSGQVSASYATTAGSSVTLRVYSKADSDLSSGVLRLNVIQLGPVDNSEQTAEALDSALESLRITFGRANISLDTLITSYAGPGNAPVPGDPLYQSIVNSQRPEAINVILAAERKGSKSNEFEYGTTGTKPFPAEPTSQSVVVISLDDITGNGIFDDSNHNDEDRLLAEEIGRFVANALGLPNLIKLSGNRVTESDDIPDSPGCISKQGCEDDSTSRTNLMFPEPLTDDDLDNDNRGQGRVYFPRDQLTAMQAQVLNNSVLVD